MKYLREGGWFRAGDILVTHLFRVGAKEMYW